MTEQKKNEDTAQQNNLIIAAKEIQACYGHHSDRLIECIDSASYILKVYSSV